jgi:DNA-binding MarR family transcriptional regulator
MDLSESFHSTLTNWTEFFMRRSMRNFFLYARQNGFTITQIAALFLIHRKGSNCISDIGDELDITNAAASQMLERLVQLGLIQRTENPNDRRFKQVTLTEKGYQALQESIAARQGWFADLADTLSEAEKGQVVSALKILIDKARQLDQGNSHSL